MTKILYALAFLIIFTFCSMNVFATSSAQTAEGLALQVQTGSLGEFNGKKYVIIPLTFFNQTDNKKIDVDGALDPVLSDEFGNLYRELAEPSGYAAKAHKAPQPVQSLYPGESSTRTLFFEAPVAKATILKLGVRAPSGVTGTPVEMDLAAPKADDDSASMIEVEPSEDGTVVYTGDVFRLHVKVNGSKLPVKVLIVAFGKTLEDTSPVQNNDYNIAIPADAPAGAESVSVIAHWTDPQKGTQDILSKNLLIYVSLSNQSSNF